jgi:nucleoside-diphosphate-sugar epimerase
MRILITGGAGYIGSVLLPKVLEKYQVRVLDNLTYGYDGIIPYINHPNLEFINGDIRNSTSIKNSLKGVDFVIHLAAIVGYPACKAKPHLAHEINYLATKKLVSLCKVPILFTSTGSNYGHVKGICDEGTSLNPLTEYGQTKVKAEKEIKKSADFIIYRFSTGFGLSPRLRLDLLVNDFLFKAMKDKELIVFEKDYWRSFIHVKDMAESLVFALEHFERMNHEIFNVGSEELCMTKVDVARRIKNHVDFYLKFADFNKDPDERNYRVSFKKIRNLGFTTKHDIDFGITEMKKAFEVFESRECYYNNRVFK